MSGDDIDEWLEWLRTDLENTRGIIEGQVRQMIGHRTEMGRRIGEARTQIARVKAQIEAVEVVRAARTMADGLEAVLDEGKPDGI